MLGVDDAQVWRRRSNATGGTSRALRNRLRGLDRPTREARWSASPGMQAGTPSERDGATGRHEPCHGGRAPVSAEVGLADQAVHAGGLVDELADVEVAGGA